MNPQDYCENWAKTSEEITAEEGLYWVLMHCETCPISEGCFRESRRCKEEDD